MRQVQAGHAEPAGGHLLDRAAPHRVEQPVDVLAALAGVGLAAEPFIAIASVWCASSEIEPYDIAPVENRLTIS